MTATAMDVRRAVAGVGDNCLDEYLGCPDERRGTATDDQADTVTAGFVGGNAVNVAVGLAGLGRPASYFGAVGDDGAGGQVREVLASRGVDVSHVRVVAGGSTGLTRIRLMPDGDRVFETEEFGTSASYVPDDREMTALRGYAAVHLGLLGDPGHVRRHLAGAGVLVTQDCSVARGFDNLDVAFCSEAVTGDAADAAERAVAGGAQLCVVTRGAHGSLAHDGTRWWECPAEPIEAVDTTGAGDSFIAGFVDGFLDSRDVAAALRTATRQAARTCTRLGAW